MDKDGKEKVTIKISKHKIIIYILFLALAYPEGCVLKLGLGNGMDYFRYLAIILFLLMLILKKVLRFDAINWIMILFYLFLSFSCVINGNSLFRILVNILYGCGICIIFSYYLKCETSLFLLCGASYFSFITFLNTFMALFCPDDFISIGDTITFLGDDNNSVGYYLLAILFSYLWTQTCKTKVGWCTWLNIVSLIVYSFVRDIATAKVCIFLIAVLLLFFKNDYISNLRFKGSISFILILVMNYFIVVVRIQEKIGEYVVTLLGRKTTFSSRNIIWDIFFHRMHGHYLAGVGILEGRINHTMGYLYYWDNVNTGNPHNMFLQYLLFGGVFVLILFVVLWAVAFVRYDLQSKDVRSNFILVIMITFMIRGIVEVGTRYFCFFLPFLYYVVYLEKSYLRVGNQMKAKDKGELSL